MPTDAERGITTAKRVASLLRHLGIARAHIVRGVDEAADHPEIVASLAFEKNHPRGRLLSRPLGMRLLGAGLAMTALALVI